MDMNMEQQEQAAAAAGVVLVKCEGGAAGRRGGGVGRLVDSTQADDRRMIQLVRERPLLYARSNLPVASYHSQVKKLWRQVADIMGWTVADVRRKWSHIRNSYSRHLRNEIHGVRTGRGRMVSKWYLADELEFLREHMATDTRPCPLSLVSAAALGTHFLAEEARYAGYELETETVPEPAEAAVEVRTEPEPVSAPYSDDGAAYFHFFRGIYRDYRELSPRRQRRFRRQCLVFLHRLLDGAAPDSAPHSSDSDTPRSSAHPA